MLNNDEIITYICIILSFINISILFYVYFIDKNKIQYLFYIFNIFIFFLIIFIIYFSMQQNNKENITRFKKETNKILTII
jgi:phosphotransferase system  glucose/maltose/N-acetylglucosamine-specific IIC component